MQINIVYIFDIKELKKNQKINKKGYMVNISSDCKIINSDKTMLVSFQYFKKLGE